MEKDLPTKPTFKDFDPEYVQRLAAERGWKYTEKIVADGEEASLYNNPDSRTTEWYKLDMTIDELPCEYYSAFYTPNTPATKVLTNVFDEKAKETDDEYLKEKLTGSSLYSVQIFSITLPYSIENLYVESRTNLTLNNILGLSPVVFKNTKKVELEGNFSTFFRVYAEENNEPVAFTILAPNIMIRMLQDAGNYDFEFSGNKIFFYKTFAAYTEGSIPLKKREYDGLLRFGIDSAKIAARAARPTRLPEGMQKSKMWQNYGASKAKWALMFAAVLFCFALVPIIIVNPILWPVGILLLVWFTVRYFRLRAKRNALKRDWK